MFENYIPTNSLLKTVNLASADRFSNEKKDIKRIENLGCSVRDMEGGAISQVCFSNEIKLIMVKGVTDIYGSPSSQYYENKLKVCKNFSRIINNILSLLN